MDWGTEYGDLAPLVKVAGWLVSAAWAVIFVWRGRSGRWAPIEEAIPGGTSRVAGLLTAIGLALLWWQQAADLTQGRWLMSVLFPAVACVVFAFIVSTFALKVLTYDGARAPIIGGLWLTPDARAVRKQGKDTIQNILAGNEFEPDRVWPRLSRAAAIILLLALYLALTVAGSLALASGAILVLLSRQPRVADYSIAPLELPAGESAVIRWRVTNADDVTIKPIGQVPLQGERTIQPTADTAVYTLTASNAYGSRGIELGVRFKPASTAAAPAAAPPPLRTRTSRPAPARPTVPVASTPSPPPKPQPLIKEARECELVRGVVIRGSGWLQAETDAEDLTIARCNVQLARGGRYEVLVRYASMGSRPVRITLDNRIINESALAASTGGWMEPNWKDESQGVHDTSAGMHVIEFRTERLFPHIQHIRIVPVS